MNSRILTVLFACALAPAAVAAAEPAPENTAAVPLAAEVSAPSARDQLLASLSRQLTDRFQVRGDLQIELMRPLTMPAEAGPVDLVILDCPPRLAASLVVRVRLERAGQVLGEQNFNLRAQLFRDVYFARAPLDRESPFDPAQLDTRRVDVLREHDTVAVGDCEGDYTLAASVSAGRMIIWRDITRRTLVRKGQIIEVAAVDGAMTITTKALAMESGAAGETIKVRNLTSRKDFTACVVSEAYAQVRF